MSKIIIALCLLGLITQSIQSSNTVDTPQPLLKDKPLVGISVPPVLQPADPLTKPVDPSTKPVDPQTKPVDPLNKPVDLLTKPADPLTKPADPLTKPADPLTKPVDLLTKPVLVSPPEKSKPVVVESHLDAHLLLPNILTPLQQSTQAEQNTYNVYKACENHIYNRANVFTVTGSGDASMEPTVGIVVLGVSITSKTAQDALAQVEAIMTKSVSSITASVTVQSLTTFKTTELSVSPKTTYGIDPKTNIYATKNVGYTVTHVLTARTKDLSQVAVIIDKGIYGGLNDIRSVTYDIEPSEKLLQYNNLIKNAVTNAVARATLALQAIGQQIASVKSVNIIEPYSQPIQYKSMRYSMMAAESFGDSPTQTFAGKTKVTAQVQVSFLTKLILPILTL